MKGLSYNPFAKQVHTDNTEKSVLTKIRRLTEIKADYLLSGRARIINIWRPIKHPVHDCALAVMDAATLREDDVIECDRRRQDTGEFWDTMGVIKYRRGYQWYYMSQQADSDVLLFKGYDSLADVPARVCVHTAFDLPQAMVPSTYPTRESIEVRALIFTYPTHDQASSHGVAILHPLTESLMREQLKLVDHHSITDRIRTDIDEGKEVKDALLLLRHQEKRQLQHLIDRFHDDYEQLALQLSLVRDQLSIESRHAQWLEAMVADLSEQLQLRDLAVEGTYPRAELPRASSDSKLSARRATPSAARNDHENRILKQQLERANLEIQKWKGEAMGRGNDAISRAFQGSVDEIVRREREKDILSSMS